MSIKSVHITNYYHKTSGGISTSYNKLLEAADRRRRSVRLIVPGEINSVEDVGEFGRIYYVKANFSPVFDKRYRLMLPWNTYLFDNAPIKAILREEKPDIIEIGEKYTLSLMAGLLRKHVIHTSQKRPMLVHLSCERMDDNVGSFIGKGHLSEWFTRRYIANFVLPMFDFHLANSEYTAQEFRDAVSAMKDPHRSNRFFNYCWRLLRAPQVALNERIFVNQCGVDNVTFTPSRRSAGARRAIEQKHGLLAETKLVLYAGRISPEKNVGLLADAMKELVKDGQRDYYMLVAGSGPAEETLRLQAERAAPGRVKMLGHIGDKGELADLFANCDAFIHPNPREPFGITPLEAMASGLPLVAPDSGGVLSYANDTNAWVTKPNGESFAAAVRDIFADAGRREEKVQNALETSGRYTWDASTDSIFELYDQMYATFQADEGLYDYTDSPDEIDFAGVLTAC